MKYSLPLLLAGFLSLTASHLSAQAISDFEDVTLPGADTTYLDTQVPNGDGVYPFTSGIVTYYGNVSFGYWGNFNCSNHTDSITPGYTNSASTITGSGFDNSANFGVAFVGSDWGQAGYPTIPVGVKIHTDTPDYGMLYGVYVTNTTYTYHYMADDNYYENNQFWYKLIIHGYQAGTAYDDSVVVTLADFSDGNNVLVNTWQWIDLTGLQDADSLSFNVASNDTVGGFGINTPAYFAIDNLTTLNNNCPAAANITVADITANSATVNWVNSSLLNIVFEYEIAIDQNPALEPNVTPVSLEGGTYNAASLEAATLYYVHIRTKCTDDSYSDWDTASFTTLGGTGIFDINDPESISVSPNPATDILNLQVTRPVDIAVYDINGRLVTNARSATSVDVSGLAPGLYMIKVFDNMAKQTGTAKFVKR